MNEWEFTQAVRYALEVGEGVAKENGVRVYAAVGLAVDHRTNEVVIRGKWLNLEAPVPEWMPGYDIEAIACSKLGATLFHRSDTPHSPQLEGDPQWKGGVTSGNFFIGVSGAEEAVDRTVALSILRGLTTYRPPFMPYIHHFGVRFATMENLDAAIRAMEEAMFRGVTAPVSDHKRVYFPLCGPQGQPGIWLEFQYFPGKDYGFGCHVDMVDAHPGELAYVLATDRDSEVIELEGEPKYLFTVSGDFAVMVRSTEGGLWRPGN